MSVEGRVIDPRFHMDPDFIEQETANIRIMLKHRHKKFMGDRPPIDLTDKNVIIVDDGIATGNTMLVSVDLVRHHAPKKVVVATPVAAARAVGKLKQNADDFVCLYAPKIFMAVGQLYEDFSQVTDDEISEFLNK